MICFSLLGLCRRMLPKHNLISGWYEPTCSSSSPPRHYPAKYRQIPYGLSRSFVRFLLRSGFKIFPQINCPRNEKSERFLKMKMRKCREQIPLHFLILSPFPLHFLILSPFSRSPAARLPQVVQPCHRASILHSQWLTVNWCSIIVARVENFPVFNWHCKAHPKRHKHITSDNRKY